MSAVYRLCALCVLMIAMAGVVVPAEAMQAMPAMAADADPNWEVAAIRRSQPSNERVAFTGASRHFQMLRASMDDLMKFAFDVTIQQIVGGPDWQASDRFDIMTGDPDVPGDPSSAQLKLMLRKLLAQRFGLKYHEGKKVMSAYVLTVAKAGPKLTASPAGLGQIPSFTFPKLGWIVIHNSTMDDFCHGLQFVVFDRPVVNHTGLTGRWDGSLKFSPDETQYSSFVTRIVPNDAPDAPPPVFTAIQEQMGLKLDAEKTAVDVLVLDHLERPNDN